MKDCLDMLKTVTESGDEKSVLVTVARVRGSGPREVGAQMLVSMDKLLGTIGGGNFEYNAIDLAREILSDNDQKPHLQEYPLGPALGQCCGGVVTLLFEPVTSRLRQHFNQAMDIADASKTAVSIVNLQEPADRLLLADNIIPVMAANDIVASASDLLDNAGAECQTYKAADGGDYLLQIVRQTKTPLYIYGAGHVGRALARAILPLSFELYWADIRAEEFPSDVALMDLTQIVTDNPVEIAENSSTGSFHLILTHDHQIDFDICESLLRKDSYGYLGMIGSDTKKARFIRRLRNRGIEDNQLDKLICPIGVSEITSKRPAEIAVAVAAEVIQYQAQIREAAIALPKQRSEDEVSISEN